jgi:hypothetical protein
VWDGADWIKLAQDRDQWWALENTVMNFRFHKRRGISWLAETLLASQDGLCSMELVASYAQSIITTIYFCFLPGRGVELTTHLHLVPRSKNEWCYTSTPQYALMAWCSVKAQGQLHVLPFLAVPTNTLWANWLILCILITKVMSWGQSYSRIL